jgi:uncharacterized coiled-coil DUF342 family protein
MAKFERQFKAGEKEKRAGLEIERKSERIAETEKELSPKEQELNELSRQLEQQREELSEQDDILQKIYRKCNGSDRTIIMKFDKIVAEIQQQIESLRGDIETTQQAAGALGRKVFRLKATRDVLGKGLERSKAIVEHAVDELEGEINRADNEFQPSIDEQKAKLDQMKQERKDLKKKVQELLEAANGSMPSENTENAFWHAIVNAQKLTFAQQQEAQKEHDSYFAFAGKNSEHTSEQVNESASWGDEKEGYQFASNKTFDTQQIIDGEKVDFLKEAKAKLVKTKESHQEEKPPAAKRFFGGIFNLTSVERWNSKNEAHTSGLQKLDQMIKKAEEEKKKIQETVGPLQEQLTKAQEALDKLEESYNLPTGEINKLTKIDQQIDDQREKIENAEEDLNEIKNEIRREQQALKNIL